MEVGFGAARYRDMDLNLEVPACISKYSYTGGYESYLTHGLLSFVPKDGSVERWEAYILRDPSHQGPTT